MKAYVQQRGKGEGAFLGMVAAALLCLPASGQVPGALSLRDQATAARDGEQVPQAIDLYKQALAADPLWTEGWWFLGNLQYKSDQYAAARDALSQYIASEPKASAALALRGLCEYELGTLPASLADIQRALALGAANQPRNAQILLYHEALLLTRLGRFEEAIAKYTPFVKQGLSNDEVALGLGLAGLRISVPPAAASAADRELALGSGRAAIQIINGDLTGGREAFRILAAANPTRANLHFFCGYLLLTTDPDQGIEELRQELAVAPASQPAHTMLGWILELRGDFNEALPVAQAAVREDAASPTNQVVLGRALLEADDVQDALGHLNQVVASDPGNLEAHISLAKAYSLLGRREEAHQERMLCLKLADGGTPYAP